MADTGLVSSTSVGASEDISVSGSSERFSGANGSKNSARELNGVAAFDSAGESDGVENVVGESNNGVLESDSVRKSNGVGGSDVYVTKPGNIKPFHNGGTDDVRESNGVVEINGLGGSKNVGSTKPGIVDSLDAGVSEAVLESNGVVGVNGVGGSLVAGEPDPDVSRPESVFRLLESVLQSLQEEGALDDGRGGKVTDWKHPDELRDILDLDLGKDGIEDNTKLLHICRQVIHYSVKTGHRHFLNQLYGGLDPYGLAGAWISEALNTNQYTYEVAPAFTLAEHEVLQKVLGLIGFQDGGDGIFSPGGSISNMYAMSLARYRLDPDTKLKGLSHLPPLCVFTSEDSHYSMLKAAHWLGIGMDNVIRVGTNTQGQMVPSLLEAAVEDCRRQKKLPLFVNATAGTTVLGAFDPFKEIADLCERQNVWMHVDACWGGSLLFSKKYSYVLKDIHRANSVSWNPHKMLGAPLQCSVLLIKEKGLLHQSNATAATYLFQQDKFYDVSFDTGDKSVQCGRKVDAFKLWLMWKARGDSGFERLVDNAVDFSRYFLSQISTRSGFRLVIPEFQCTNICFWYIPISLRDKPEDDTWWSTLSKVAPRIKEKLVLRGTLMIGYQPLHHRNLHNFFRLVTTCHPPPSTDDMDHVIQQIELHGAEVDEEIKAGRL